MKYYIKYVLKRVSPKKFGDRLGNIILSMEEIVDSTDESYEMLISKLKTELMLDDSEIAYPLSAQLLLE